MARKTLLAAALLAALPVTASAAGFNWNATLASDYLFRGIDQNDDQPALQLGAGFEFESGLYVGAWGSNIDFGDSTDLEIDTFIGWAGDLGETTSLDVQLVRYNYVGEPAGVDYAYNELVTSLGVGENLSFTLGYTNDYFNAELDSLYYGVGGSWEFAGDYTFSASVGYTTVEGSTLEDYADYSLGVSRAFGPATVSLNYVNTSSDAEVNFGPDLSEDKILLTIGFEG